MIKIRKILQHVIAGLTFILGMTACNDMSLHDEPDVLQPNTGASDEFWHTRTLSRAQKLELKRKFGLGFSYDAIYGGKCDMGYVRCQVLDLDAVADEGFFNYRQLNQTKDSTVVAHSFSDYCQVTDLASNVSDGVLIYKADYSKVSSVFEHGMDTVVCFYNKRSLERVRMTIDTLEMSYMASEDLHRCLTPSFRYGIDKIKKSSKGNTLVVDSFINIYGTHVIMDVKIGAQVSLDVKTRKGIFYDYISEQTITKEHLDLLFYNKENTHTEKDEQFIKQVIDNSTMSLQVKGGAIYHISTIL